MSELYELPNEWEWILFKDSLYLTDFVANGSFASLKENVSYLDYKDYAILVRLKDFSHKWNGDYIYVDKHSYDFLSKSSLFENDIMMCNVGSVGLHFRVPNLGQPMTIGPNSILIRPQIDELDNTFLYYYFSSNIFKDFLETITATTAQPKFNKTGFKTLSIPLPPLSEQQRIVSKLDKLFEKIDKAIALHQQNMDEADVFMGSVLNEVFGELEEKYGLSLFKDIIDNKIQNGLYKHKDFYNDSATQILRIDNFYNGKINKYGIKRLTLDEAELDKYSLDEGDIVINRVNSMEYLGKCAFVDKLSEPMVFESNMMRIKVSDNINSLYIVNMLQTEHIKNYISVNAKRAVNQCSINQTDVNGFTFPIPPFPIQQKVVTYLDEITNKIEKVKSIQKEKMDSLTALKASILDKAFRGEL